MLKPEKQKPGRNVTLGYGPCSMVLQTGTRLHGVITEDTSELKVRARSGLGVYGTVTDCEV
jgi:hypothetical protein